jgi:hypothetical protein
MLDMSENYETFSFCPLLRNKGQQSKKRNQNRFSCSIYQQKYLQGGAMKLLVVLKILVLSFKTKNERPRAVYLSDQLGIESFLTYSLNDFCNQIFLIKLNFD